MVIDTTRKISVEVVREAGKDSNGHKFFVYSSGADTPRPVHLKKSNKTDLWYVNAYSSLYVDVKLQSIRMKRSFE